MKKRQKSYVFIISEQAKIWFFIRTPAGHL